ncbi:hypothetical protein NMY22_g14528 [Coprinellus aureogranulatus]|nr:hypothetical protein NMY22_g14528 [Coprinellus aureogranulatus]
MQATHIGQHRVRKAIYDRLNTTSMGHAYVTSSTARMDLKELVQGLHQAGWQRSSSGEGRSLEDGKALHDVKAPFIYPFETWCVHEASAVDTEIDDMKFRIHAAGCYDWLRAELRYLWRVRLGREEVDNRLRVVKDKHRRQFPTPCPRYTARPSSRPTEAQVFHSAKGGL